MREVYFKRKFHLPVLSSRRVSPFQEIQLSSLKRAPIRLLGVQGEGKRGGFIGLVKGGEGQKFLENSTAQKEKVPKKGGREVQPGTFGRGDGEFLTN